MKATDRSVIALFSLFLISSFFIFRELPFFWDGISKSGRADWIYSNNFKSIIVPTEINSGHPPLWISLIALFWTVFGKSVASARLLLLLVNLGVFYQIFSLSKKLLPPNVSRWWVLLVFLEPTLLAQTTNLGNDMLLLFFTLLALNALLSNHKLLLLIALSGVLLSNLRGIYMFIAIGLIHVIAARKNLMHSSKFPIVIYLLGTLPFLGFLYYQYQELGWVLISKSEAFAGHREAAGWKLVLKNIAGFGKHALEFGRIFLWIPMGILFIPALRSYKNWPDRQKILLVMLAVFTLVLFLGIVPFSNPHSPRYLMICFVLAILLFINLLFGRTSDLKKIRLALVVVAAGFISGHLWIYPPKISQAWDCSFAYLNYFPVEKKMLDHLESEAFNTREIGTNLPIHNKKMANAAIKMKVPTFAAPDLDSNVYFMFSNVENRTEEAEIDLLMSDWKEVIKFEQMGVFITLYENPLNP